MMKGELSSIRSRLESMGPLRSSQPAADSEAPAEHDSIGTDTKPIRIQLTQQDGDAENGDDTTVMAPTGIPVYHVDTNKFPQVGLKNNVHGLPTLVLYYEGEEIWRNEGILLAGDIIKELTRLHEERGWSDKAAAQNADSIERSV